MTIQLLSTHSRWHVYHSKPSITSVCLRRTRIGLTCMYVTVGGSNTCSFFCKPRKRDIWTGSSNPPNPPRFVSRPSET